MTASSAGNIVLIGMPAAGKSTLGVLLAKQLGYDFVDTDLLIQRHADMTLASYLKEHGYQALLRLEAQVIQALTLTHTVIATGGSAVCSPAAMQHLQQNGHIVYLQCALGVLNRRITSMSERGIAAASGQTLADVQQERIPLYRQFAQITIDVTDLRLEQAVTEILTLLAPSTLEP